MHPLHDALASLDLLHPLSFLAVFLVASLLMIWRLEALQAGGLEGTALGTLVMPYCSGLGNLVFVFLLLRDHGPPGEIVINSVVNNATNLTLLLGLPAAIWGLRVLPAATPTASAKIRGRKARARSVDTAAPRLTRLSLLLTLTAVGFFTGAIWALGQDGTLDRTDGWALIGLFVFWQCFQVFDVLKHNVRQNVRYGLRFYADLFVVLLGAWLVYESLDALVAGLAARDEGFFSAARLGWITGWLLVLPNALLAFYYAARGRADVVYSSQVGDGHICIPLCIGLFAAFRPITLPDIFEPAMAVIGGAALVHALCLLLGGRLPRWVGVGLIGAYGWFLYTGLLG